MERLAFLASGVRTGKLGLGGALGAHRRADLVPRRRRGPRSSATNETTGEGGGGCARDPRAALCCDDDAPRLAGRAAPRAVALHAADGARCRGGDAAGRPLRPAGRGTVGARRSVLAASCSAACGRRADARPARCADGRAWTAGRPHASDQRPEPAPSGAGAPYRRAPWPRRPAADRRVRRRRLLDGGRQPAARRLRARARPGASGRGSASCRPPRATPTTTSCASTARSRRALRAVATSRCSGATAAAARSRATSRRTCSTQDLIYVGGGSVVSLLGAWRAHGLDRDPARGLAARRRAVRPERRLAVLVRRGGHRLPRRAAARARASGCCRTPTACTTTASRSGATEYHRFVGDGHARAATPPTTARRCTSSGSELQRVVSSRPGRARLPRRAASTARSSRSRCRRRYLGARGAARAGRRRMTPATAILAMGGGGFTMEPGNPALDDFVARAAGAPRAADPLPADRLRRLRRAQIAALPRDASATAPASPTRLSLFRLPGERRPLARDRARAGRRSTSAAARCATCWRSGARTGSTSCCARRGTAASCSPASAPARCAGSQGGVTTSGGPPGAGRRRSACCPARSRVHADGEPERAAGVPRRRRGAARCPAAGRPTTASGCCSAGTRLERVVSSRARRRGAARRRVDGELRRDRIEPSCSARRRRRRPAVADVPGRRPRAARPAPGAGRAAAEPAAAGVAVQRRQQRPRAAAVAVLAEVDALPRAEGERARRGPAASATGPAARP